MLSILVENSGKISASGAEASSGRNIAIDLSSVSAGATVRQTLCTSISHVVAYCICVPLTVYYLYGAQATRNFWWGASINLTAPLVPAWVCLGVLWYLRRPVPRQDAAIQTSPTPSDGDGDLAGRMADLSPFETNESSGESDSEYAVPRV